MFDRVLERLLDVEVSVDRPNSFISFRITLCRIDDRLEGDVIERLLSFLLGVDISSWGQILLTVLSDATCNATTLFLRPF